MDNTGHIRDLADGEQPAADETLISADERAALEMFPQEQRPGALNHLREPEKFTAPMRHNLTVWDVASICHEANRALCRVNQEQNISPAWDDASDEMRLSAMRGVEAVLENPNVTPEQLHQLWMNNKFAEGWHWGERKDEQAKTHPCLVPYEQLSESQRVKDVLFRNIVTSLMQFMVIDEGVGTDVKESAAAAEA